MSLLWIQFEGDSPKRWMTSKCTKKVNSWTYKAGIEKPHKGSPTLWNFLDRQPTSFRRVKHIEFNADLFKYSNSCFQHCWSPAILFIFISTFPTSPWGKKWYFDDLIILPLSSVYHKHITGFCTKAHVLGEIIRQISRSR